MLQHSEDHNDALTMSLNCRHRYFIVGEVYQMGRGIFLFVGGPLASLIAPVRKGHRIFYFINSLQAFVLLTILIASWRRYGTPRFHCFYAEPASTQAHMIPVKFATNDGTSVCCSTGFSRCAKTFGCALKRQCLCLWYLNSTIEYCL